MKPSIYFAAAVFTLFAACKTPYKATDTPTANVDSTSATADSSSMNKMPAASDSAHMRGTPDSTQMPSTTDSTRMPSSTDSLRMPTNPDSTSKPSRQDTSGSSGTDSLTMPIVKDSSQAESDTKSSQQAVVAPDVIQTAFTKQYPGASNAEWANYDSLAAVPIDLRMAGWKKMDAEDYMVVFDMDNDKYYAWYDHEGKWVGSASKLEDTSKLPVAVNTAIKNAIKTKYTGYTISNVNREFQKDKKAYEVELIKDNSKVRMLVSSTGKITQVYKYVNKIKE